MTIKLRELEDQVIVITGASSGIGLATALAACRENSRLVLAARSEQALADVARQLEVRGAEVLTVVADVSERAQVERIAERALDRFGAVHSWINNAGVSIYGRLDQVSEADSRRLFDVNFWGVVHGSLVAIPLLTDVGGGALINVGSEVSEAFVPMQGMYTASKHAVKGFTDSLRVEVQEIDRAPVSITLVQPPAVDTPYPEHARNYMDREPKLPSPQIDPMDVAEAILHACTKPTPFVKVGLRSKLSTLGANLMPSLMTKMVANLVEDQQRNEAPERPEGTLYAPGESGRTHGRPEEGLRVHR